MTYTYICVYKRIYCHGRKFLHDLPLPDGFPHSGRIKKITLLNDWSIYLNILKRSEHKMMFSDFDINNLSGNEISLLLNIEPKESKTRIEGIISVCREISSSVLLSMRLDPTSAATTMLDIFIDNDNQIYGAQKYIIQYVGPTEAREMMDDTIKLINATYPSILKTRVEYYSAIGKDVETDTPPDGEYQIRNRLMKSMRWWSLGLMIRDYDPRFVCFVTALEALTTNESKGKATIIFKKRVKYLARKCGSKISDQELDDLYDLRSRFVHGDMAQEYSRMDKKLMQVLYALLTSILKYIHTNKESYKCFASNDSPDKSLVNIKKYFSEADR